MSVMKLFFLQFQITFQSIWQWCYYWWLTIDDDEEVLQMPKHWSRV
jgi:hypothetical protein